MNFREKDFESLPANRRRCATLRSRLTGSVLGLSLAAAVCAGPAQAGNPGAVGAGLAESGKSASNVTTFADLGPEKTSMQMPKVGQKLTALYDEYSALVAKRGAAGASDEFRTNAPFMQTTGDLVVVDAVADEDPTALLADLEALGLQNGSVFGRVVSGKLPISALSKASGLTSLRFARPAMAMVNAGSVQSEAVKAMRVNRAAKVYGVKGRGVRVGVLSDSYNCLGGAAADIASKDLPAAKRIIILDDAACGSDEGRAMMQLIRDVAPLSKLAFHSAFNGLADFANGILELSQKTKGKSNIITDDVIYFGEPMFQDGIVAQAVDKVKKKGIPYYSSAGNNGRGSWESGSKGFEQSGEVHPSFGPLHDFNTGSGKDAYQLFRMGTGVTIIVLQWDEPFASASTTGAGSASDLDFFALESDQNTIVDLSVSFNVGNDAIEILALQNTGAPRDINLVITHFSGPEPKFLKYVIFGPGSNDVNDPPASFPKEYATDSGTIYGHALAAGAMAVGAVHFKKTPPFGTNNPAIEPFSSAGGTPLFIKKNGDRMSKKVRNKPEISAVDGVDTTFFGKRDENGIFSSSGTHFFGTSAAAPNAAAVAALIKEIDPNAGVNKINTHLKKTAKDMNDPATGGSDPGFDFGTGFGLIDALKAVRRADNLK